MSIAVQNLTKTYKTQNAVNDISFSIHSGEIVGFIGPNGAGKTTTMKIICGFLQPTKGIVTVNDFDVVKNSIDVRRCIGYLPEHNPLYLEMYVKEFLEFSAGIFKISNIRNRVANIIEQTGLGVEQHKKIGQLSKGFRQRVGLAHALIHDPAVLILDEPTTGLDPNQIVEIRSLISEVGKSKTVMLSTHIMQEVEAICDRVIILNRGEIVADGNASSIQQKTQQFNVLVEWNQVVAESDLLKIQGVETALRISDKVWVLSNQNDFDSRESIFKYAVEHGLTVLSMQKQEKSLEKVFQELTSKTNTTIPKLH